MEEKKYYWLKLDKDFFEDDTIVWLEEQENGVYYINFYLKLLLRSLDEEGTLVRYIGNMLVPYDAKSLSKLTNTPVDTVMVALELFINIGLIKRLDAGELYMSQIDEMIGSETSAARRMRKMRAKEKALELPNKDDRNNVRECYVEKELERELEQETDKFDYKSVIDYLNLKTGKNFKNVDGNNKFIRSRYNEGYELEDFKTVIDNMVTEWSGTEWYNNGKLVTGDSLLRPQTLFGNKFDSYLNKVVKKKEISDIIEYS